MRKKLIPYIFLYVTLCCSYYSRAQDPVPDTIMKLEDSIPPTFEPATETSQHQDIFTSIKNDTITYAQKHLPPDFITRLQANPSFSYVKDGLPEQNKGNATRFRIPGFIAYILFAILITVLIWYLVTNNIFSFKRNTSLSNTEPGDEPATDNIFEINYPQAIQKALANKDYRMAIRLQYLQVLKMLANRNMIHYQPDKTNHEYLFQLQGSRHYDPFYTLTRNYEYSWYGLFDVDDNKYQRINNIFKAFEKDIR